MYRTILPLAICAAALTTVSVSAQAPPDPRADGKVDTRWEHHGCKQPVRVSEFRELVAGAWTPFTRPSGKAVRDLRQARLCAVNRKHARTMRSDQRRARAPYQRTRAAVFNSPNRPHLVAIAQCESGGDPTAVSANGTYRGKFQFDYGTWASVGGSGDPAAAPELEQDYRADLLYDSRGAQPWPVCGS